MDKHLEEDLYRENLEISSISKRTRAYIVDELIISILVIVAFWEKVSNTQSIEESILIVNSLFIVVICLKIAYQTIFIYLYGATLGKLWQKIFVINIDDFGRPSFMFALTRAIIRILSEWLFYFGYIWAYFNDTKQTWHDKVAKSIVVNA